jgi:hypothetical protein
MLPCLRVLGQARQAAYKALEKERAVILDTMCLIVKRLEESLDIFNLYLP